MIQFSKEATDDEFSDAICKWIDLLAADNFEEAHEMMYRLPDDKWTPELMRTVVRNYGFIEPRKDGKVFSVTPISQANQRTKHKPRRDLEWHANGDGVAHFDLPLNGEWSDVTAIIDILRFGEKRVLRLDDIHVL
jgi:hypothetical protein